MHIPRLLQLALLTDDQVLATALERLLQDHLLLKRFSTIGAFREHQTFRHFDALFCDWSFGTGAWQDALKAIRDDCPHLPVIILSRNAGEREWVSVIEAGAFDLLVPPYRLKAVLAVLEQATASRQARHRHLMEQKAHEEAS